MSDIDSKLLDALRQLGVDVPDKPPTTLQACGPLLQSQTPRPYWMVSNGAMSTCVDPRDASDEDEAIRVARTDYLQPWYINGHLADAITVKQVSRSEYLDWLKRGLT